jgi:hypothetical protein
VVDYYYNTNIPRRRRVGPIITQQAEEKNDGLPALL